MAVPSEVLKAELMHVWQNHTDTVLLPMVEDRKRLHTLLFESERKVEEFLLEKGRIRDELEDKHKKDIVALMELQDKQLEIRTLSEERAKRKLEEYKRTIAALKQQFEEKLTLERETSKELLKVEIAAALEEKDKEIREMKKELDQLKAKVPLLEAESKQWRRFKSAFQQATTSTTSTDQVEMIFGKIGEANQNSSSSADALGQSSSQNSSAPPSGYVSAASEEISSLSDSKESEAADREYPSTDGPTPTKLFKPLIPVKLKPNETTNANIDLPVFKGRRRPYLKQHEQNSILWACNYPGCYRGFYVEELIKEHYKTDHCETLECAVCKKITIRFKGGTT